jgi:hypothetical protein
MTPPKPLDTVAWAGSYLGGRYPINGLVGICSSCGWSGVTRRDILAKWRRTAPPLVQIIPGKPVQLVARDAAMMLRWLTSSEIPSTKSQSRLVEKSWNTS